VQLTAAPIDNRRQAASLPHKDRALAKIPVELAGGDAIMKEERQKKNGSGVSAARSELKKIWL
jgi:hypothetical protein